jgi:hypothetical protein
MVSESDAWQQLDSLGGIAVIFNDYYVFIYSLCQEICDFLLF